MSVSTFRTFSDPDAFHAAIRARQVDGVVTGRGQFHAELTRVDFDSLLMQRAEEHLPRVFHMETAPQRAAFIFVTDQGQPPMQVGGLPLHAGEIIAWNSGLSGHHKSATAVRWGSMSLKIDELSKYGEAILGRDLPTPLVPERIRPPEPLARRLLNLHETVAQLAKITPDLLAHPEVARAIEQALVEALVSCLMDGDTVKSRSGVHKHAKVVRRLEQILQANPEQALYMSELCAAVGASYPTLRACCQEHLGMSPKRYLWLRRMHLARRALKDADPEVATVTQAATEYGFWELGRFSVNYHSLLGDSPSATLRRPSEGPISGEIDGPLREFIKTA